MYQSLEITTNAGCKARCVYCPQDAFLKEYFKESKTVQLSLKNFKKVLAKLPIEVGVHFTGFSEPWLNKDCTKMVLHAFKKGHQITVSTSAMGMTIKDIDAIKKIPFSVFILHLPDNHFHTKIKVDKTYCSVIEKILNSNISNLVCKCCAISKDDDFHPKLKKLLEEKKIIGIVKTKLTHRAGNVEILAKNKKKILGKLSECERLHRNVLLPDGRIVLCCMDWRLNHILGNLLEIKYNELFSGREFRNVLAGLKKNDSEIVCRHCERAKKQENFLVKKLRHIKAKTANIIKNQGIKKD